MQLTEHFDREEFELHGVMPEECVPMYTSLAHTLLEVIRAQFGQPMRITSGYRNAADNAAVHGVRNSQHEATANQCAADFEIVATKDLRAVFDWVRQQTNLVWDQLILEHSSGDDIIHISLVRGTNRRQALEGKVENMSAYTSWSVAQFQVTAV